MLPFPVALKTGSPVSEQLLYAVEKAVISGQLQPGDRFPSVRALSQELRINPNTAHKVVTVLVSQGLLEVQPGIGTIVGKQPKATAQQRSELLGDDVEHLVVEAKKLQLGINDLTRAVESHWNNLTNPYAPHH
jgi:DNA-binding transcriptional regulator YhcF (GntR family)